MKFPTLKLIITAYVTFGALCFGSVFFILMGVERVETKAVLLALALGAGITAFAAAEIIRVLLAIEENTRYEND